MRRNRMVYAKKSLYHAYFVIVENGVEISHHYRFLYYYNINSVQIEDLLISTVDLKENQTIFIKSVTKLN